MAKRSSLQILTDFLKRNQIPLRVEPHLQNYIINSDDLIELPDDIVEKIICDAYEANSQNVKKISELLLEKYDHYFGYIQKEQLKKYLDYGYESDFKLLIDLIHEDFHNTNELKKICDDEIKNNRIIIQNSVKLFLKNLNMAINDKRDKRVKDYLVFIYSRLLAINEKRKLSLREIFETNSHRSVKELGKKQFAELKAFCNSNEKLERFIAVNKFNSKYLHILDHDDNNGDKSAVIYLNISQDLFDNYSNKNEFYYALFTFIKKAYEELENHKTLLIKIGNIISDKINIKWELYSYLSIFAEKFIKDYEKRPYFFPEQHCKDDLEYRLGIKISKNDEELLRQYYDQEISFDKLEKQKSFPNSISQKFIDEFRYVYTGFTFIDCIVLSNPDESYPNSEEVEFIKNNNELFLVFFKHKIDSRRIPCPICASLDISGNSFPEIGIRSWECKNPLCSQRSKTNRGKRYSARTIFMQDSTFDFSKANIIPKELVQIWRKDLVENWNFDDFYHMITKYYSFVDDTITIINAENANEFSKIAKSEKRKLKQFRFDEFIKDVDHSLYNNFFEKSGEIKFIDHFICQFDKNSIIPVKSLDSTLDNKAEIIHGDCIQVLKTLPKPVHNMVTSPPYYNVREYTQWENLYQYLHDMYLIALESYRVLQAGGVFFFNIGDIFDNEKIIVKSKMGEKRIPLGAYIILIFQKAGFELLDNVVWYKGEPQSNRHKNDGNYVPYYQRPTNCYEHMFILKKAGTKLKLNKNRQENPITKNIQKFIPVYKIVQGGINTYGHTAPFPEDIPRMSVLCFTNTNEIVVDPFVGSGTSVIVAANHNRKGIGIEKNQEYVQLSKERLLQREIQVILKEFSSRKLQHSNVNSESTNDFLVA